jgi:hypothetical protein
MKFKNYVPMCLKNKIKTTIAITSIIYSTLIIAQDKLLTIQDAVLKGRTSLAPKRLQSLSFIKGANKFSYIDNNIVKVGEALCRICHDYYEKVFFEHHNEKGN